MKTLKQILVLCILGIFFYACGSTSVKNVATQKEEPVVIANDSLEYEITIIDLGFNLFLNTVAHSRGFYSQEYMETRNQFFVTNWNIRARNPNQFNANIYENVIDYQPNIDYGFEVNYLLYNYFMFAQQKYNMSLGVGFPGKTR